METEPAKRKRTCTSLLVTILSGGGRVRHHNAAPASGTPLSTTREPSTTHVPVVSGGMTGYASLVGATILPLRRRAGSSSQCRSGLRHVSLDHEGA